MSDYIIRYYRMYEILKLNTNLFKVILS